MAKSKPSRAFLEALQQEKKRRGDGAPGGGFKTPAWFFKNAPVATEASAPAAPAAIPVPSKLLAIPTVAGKPSYRYVWWHGAVAGGVLLCVVVGAIAFGRGQPAPKASVAGEAAKSSAPQSSALDVPTDRPTTGIKPPALIPVAPQPQAIAPAQPGVHPIAPAGNAAEPISRVIGMNYVVVQAYENDAKANEAADALKKSGIGCTVERLPAYNSRFVLVVGTTAFAHTGTADYDQYLKRIMQVSEKYAGSSKWKKFAPNAYKWK